jgi:xylulokinase
MPLSEGRALPPRPRSLYPYTMPFLGIDVGSTALKAAVFDERGRQIGAVRFEYRKPVQTADDWWRAALRCTRQLLSRNPGLGDQIEAVGLSGRGGTRVLLDRGGRPLSMPPVLAISAENQARALQAFGTRRGPHGIRFLASLLQLAEVAPREFAFAARALVAKDYVVFQMTGHAVTDPASGPDAAAWPEGIRALPALSQVHLAEVRWPWQEAGRLRTTVAEQLGLRSGVPVATGGHDGAAATIGAGAAVAGAHPVTLGTNSVYRILANDEAPQSNRFWTVLPGLIAYGADVTLGGFAVDWLARTVSSSRSRLTAAARGLAPGSDGVVFLPQMGGRILPNPSLIAAASFTGIRRGAGREHLYRAVLEGNAFALRAARDALLAQGLPEGPVFLTGGGVRNALWREILAAVLARPLRWCGVEEGCRGAAIFAAVAAGAFRTPDEAAASMTGDRQETEPGDDVEAYDDAYARFVKVRDALDGI